MEVVNVVNELKYTYFPKMIYFLSVLVFWREENVSLWQVYFNREVSLETAPFYMGESAHCTPHFYSRCHSGAIELKMQG